MKEKFSKFIFVYFLCSQFKNILKIIFGGSIYEELGGALQVVRASDPSCSPLLLFILPLAQPSPKPPSPRVVVRGAEEDMKDPND